MSNLFHLAFIIAVAALMGVLPSGVIQANSPSHFRDVDADLHVQGEYVGAVLMNGNCWRPAGLQVVAGGNRKFEALLFPGGLPGAGWDRRTNWKLSGTRQDDTVLVTRNEFYVQLDRIGPERWRAVVKDPRGHQLGTLRRVHRISPTMHAAPPTGATILFDGQRPDKLVGAKLTDDGLLNVGAMTREPVGDFRLHLEFRTPYLPENRGQRRGNSGVYVQRRYEIQILDSFGLDGKANECGGIYKQRAPDVNMCLPPLAWQTYDMYFRAARWDGDGNRIVPARITVLHNGVTIHNNVALLGKTGNGRPEGPDNLPILLQDHGNPVHFRNIWIRSYEECATSVSASSLRHRLFHGLRLRRPLLGRWD